MKKVFTFGLWGSNPTYNIGAIKNAEIINNIFPNFECWFYIHQESVPEKTINNLKLFKNTKIILKSGKISYLWRYEAIDEDDVEIMMPRDTDSRIWEREIYAINEWLKSDKIFHIMRDHPHHDVRIMAGMFGTKKIPQILSWKDLINNNNKLDKTALQADQSWLRDYIYPHIVNNSLIHASFHKWESHAISFPIPYNNSLNFVGEYVYWNDKRSDSHIEILKKCLL